MCVCATQCGRIAAADSPDVQSAAAPPASAPATAACVRTYDPAPYHACIHRLSRAIEERLEAMDVSMKALMAADDQRIDAQVAFHACRDGMEKLMKLQEDSLREQRAIGSAYARAERDWRRIAADPGTSAPANVDMLAAQAEAHARMQRLKQEAADAAMKLQAAGVNLGQLQRACHDADRERGRIGCDVAEEVAAVKRMRVEIRAVRGAEIKAATADFLGTEDAPTTRATKPPRSARLSAWCATARRPGDSGNVRGTPRDMP
jgi:hypothetical protein